MHLGRTLRVFRAADAENALVDDARNPGDFAPRTQLLDQQEELGRDEKQAMGSSSGAHSTHPSWTASAGSATTVGVAGASATAAAATADVYTAESSNWEEEHESGVQNEAESDEPEELVRSGGGGGGAVAAAAAADVVQTEHDGRIVSADVEDDDGVGANGGGVMVAGLTSAEAGVEDDDSSTRIALQQREAGEPYSLDTAAAAAAAAENTLSDLALIPDLQSQPELLLTPKIEGSATTGAPVSRDREGGKESEEEEQEEEEDVETAAVKELLRLREAQDLRVQAAADAALEKLSDRQRACFDELKAFAYSGSCDGKQDEAPQVGANGGKRSATGAPMVRFGGSVQ